jgi:hypothetical protein
MEEMTACDRKNKEQQNVPTTSWQYFSEKHTVVECNHYAALLHDQSLCQYLLLCIQASRHTQVLVSWFRYRLALQMGSHITRLTAQIPRRIQSEND